MGLDISHDCWHGAYSAFMRWRRKLAEVAGIPLMLMEGYYEFQDGMDESMQWAAPRDGGPICGSFHGPALHRYIESVDNWLPIKWASLKPDVLHVLLDHSDCDGEITAEFCESLANRLQELLPLLPDEDDGGHIGNWRTKTQQFIDGLHRAALKQESVTFG